MAVIPDCLGLKVEVVVKGEALTEYADKDAEQPEIPEPNSISNYIEAVTGAVFKIRTTFTEPFPTSSAVSVSIKIDGKKMTKALVRKEKLPSYTLVQRNVYSNVGTQNMKSTFQFSELAKEGDIEDETTHSDIDRVGEVQVSLYRVKVSRRSTVKKDHTMPAPVTEVPGKAVEGKALSHSVKFGIPKPADERRTYTSIDLDKAPFATFTFKYRSLKRLQQLLILPRSRSPSPSRATDLAEEKPEVLTSDQLVEENARLRAEIEALKNAGPGIKRERTIDDSIKNEHVDGEADSGERKTKRRCKSFKKGEVIVLD